MKDWTIKSKLTAILMFTSTLAVLLACSAFMVFDYFERRWDLVEDLSSIAEMTGRNCEAALAFDIPEDANKMLSAMATKPSILIARIYDTDGNIFASYQRESGRTGCEPPELNRKGHLFRGNYFHLFQDIELNEEIIGTVYLQADLHEIRAAFIKDAGIVAFTAFFAFVVALVLSANLQKIISKPILALAKLTREVSTGMDYSVRASKEGNDEVGLLIDAFNDMLREIQQRDEALRVSEQRFRAMFEQAAVGVAQIETNTGRYLHVNRKFTTIVNLTADELTSTTVMEITHPDDLHLVRDHFEQLQRGKVREFSIEKRYIRKDGSIVWANVTVSATWAPEEKPSWHIAVVEDITERKSAENELRNLRNYLTNIINSMPSVLVGVDADGKITQWNAEASRVTGLSAADAVGHSLAEAIPRLSSEIDLVCKAMVARKVYTDPRRSWQEDGAICYEDMTVYPLIANGVEGAVIRIDDVTDHVRMEELIVQNEKMLSIGGLAAGMAHEINNPLAGMMQTADVLAKRLSDKEIPANVKAAEESGTNIHAIHNYMENRGILNMLVGIKESGQRVAAIVENMLNFARKSDSRRTSQNLAELIDKTLELAATDYDLKKHQDFKLIDIKREYENDLPYVSCEAAKIQQVILNILRNGAQAMQENTDQKKPSHNTFTLRLINEVDKKNVRIEIEDNGPGMDEVTRKRVFEPFFTTKPLGTGTGLGLSVSYFIITEDHGGEMSVESSPGQGTKFIIRLPA